MKHVTPIPMGEKENFNQNHGKDLLIEQRSEQDEIKHVDSFQTYLYILNNVCVEIQSQISLCLSVSVYLKYVQ